MTINDIRNVPIQEHIQLMEAPWESFVHDDTTSSSAWHKENVKTYTLTKFKQQK